MPLPLTQRTIASVARPAIGAAEPAVGLAKRRPETAAADSLIQDLKHLLSGFPSLRKPA